MMGARFGPRRAVPLLGLFLLGGCGATMIPPSSLPAPAAGFTPASKPQPTGVIGADARGLIRLFGEPRLDIRDPAARKLQFSDGLCVLDAYLYAPRAKREPLVTFAEARGSDGAAMDWADCATQLSRR
jgi:hypothetical protein